MNKYDDIINLTRPISKNRKPLSTEMRAAQFAPFSALTGYAEAIKETSRITDRKIELSEGLKEIINEKLLFLKNNKYKEEVKISYFVADDKKSGGEYKSIINRIKKVDSINNLIVLENGLKIDFDNIKDIECDIFNFYL